VHRFFHSLGAGSIEEVRVTRDKGFGFVRYSTHDEAALAIQMGNGQLIGGRQIKVPRSVFSCYGVFFFSKVVWNSTL
jgi:RNA recognition motif-containing protein